MPIVTPTPVPTLGTTLPDPSDRTTYGTRGRAVWDWEVNELVPGINQLASDTYSNASEASDSALVAVAAANFKGAWSSLAGSLAVPSSVWHSGRVWALLVNLADVTLSEPGVSANWVDVGGVKRSGDDMTGHLSTVAGATGNQVPRRSEVVGLTGAETITGVKTFSVAPIVPAAPTGNQPTPANEVMGFGQTWQTVTRVAGTTYTNSTGKPIIVQAYGSQTTVNSYLAASVNGVAATFVNYSGFATTNIGTYFVVPNGSTYKIDGSGMASITVKEYR